MTFLRIAWSAAASAVMLLSLNTVCLSAGPEADTGDIASFLHDLGSKVADFKTLKTEFIQEKEMALFRDKLVLKGRIFLEKPATVAWHVDSPVRSSVLITDKVIRQWDEDTNQVREISLAKNPVFQNVLNQLTVWFSGDYSSLIGVNTISIVRREPLALEFLPMEKNIAYKVIKKITITFRDDRKYLQQIRIEERSGDVTTIIFRNTQLNVPLDAGSFEVKGHV
jgi:outer membrane lipoprotein-sorting protein